MGIIVRFIINGLSIFIASRLLPGVHLEDLSTALIVAVVLGFINTFIKPILLFFTLPINILTLGLFTLIINALLILLASRLVPGFIVDGFLWALIFSLVLSIMNSILTSVVH